MSPARQYALDFLARATRASSGVSRGDWPYERVTEGRHTAALRGGLSYSACGDLGNALLYALGLRETKYVNRAENGRYRIGHNVASLDSLARRLRDYVKRPITADDVTRLSAGDITIVWNREDTTDAHVAVVRLYEQGKLYTSDYGQGLPHDGKECVRVVSGTRLANRRLQRVIPLEQALALATAEPIPLDVYFAEPSNRPRPTLRKGSKGAAVEELQRKLGGLAVDGDFGPKTEAGVKAFQAGAGLVADGICGPKTWAALDK